jgi:UDP-2,3-diacylglucosamine hydrolase
VPETVTDFYQFINQHQSDMESLYILGDFFEVWIGDDSLDSWSEKILLSLKNTQAKLYFIAGNRDFLLSKKLLQPFNIQLLPDNSLIQIDTIQLLLAHGDQLCTDDIKYQQFRTLVRSNQWQNNFLSKTLAERQAIVLSLRDRSKVAMQKKQEDIMDVNPNTISTAFKKFNAPIIVHGHTHREAIHSEAKGKHRIVLGAWHNGIAYLKVDSIGKKVRFTLLPSNQLIETE